jgi:hypothetical protein
MKELPKLKEDQYILLMYIKEVASEQVNGFDHDMQYAICSIIDTMLDAYRLEWELE